jgi:hypothetical protein
MRAEFHGEGGEAPVGAARLAGSRVEVDAGDDAAREAIGRIFRLIPVVVDDASLRYLGASGEAILEPGDAQWFRAAAVQRAPQEGLSVRLVPEATGHGGWDPASAYRTFRQSVNRLLTPPEALPEAQL